MARAISLGGFGPLGIMLPLAVFVGVVFWPGPSPDFRAAGTGEAAIALSFATCSGGSDDNCVIDGDTFRLDGRKIRIADIDTPETGGARCAEERALGDRATDRLGELLSAGSFELTSGARDRDKYGRELRTVMRSGESIGDTLIAEGLARPWEGSRRPWCGTSDV